MKEIVKRIGELEHYLKERGCSYVISISGVKTSSGFIQGYNGICFDPKNDPSLPALIVRDSRTNTQTKELLDMMYYLLYDKKCKPLISDVVNVAITQTPIINDEITYS